LFDSCNGGAREECAELFASIPLKSFAVFEITVLEAVSNKAPIGRTDIKEWLHRGRVRRIDI
jgi:hypothetical protein